MLKAVVFDIDGTLTQGLRGWYVLTKGLGGDIEKHRQLYEAVGAGDLSVQEGIDGLMKEWQKGGIVTKEKVRSALMEAELRDDAEETIWYLKNKGYLLCLITGSVEPFAEVIANRLGTENYFGNSPLIYDDKDVLKTFEYYPSDGSKKLEQLKAFLKDKGLEPKECAVVGDSWNDAEMFIYTKNGIAIKTKQENMSPNLELEKLAWKVIEELHELKDIL